VCIRVPCLCHVLHYMTCGGCVSRGESEHVSRSRRKYAILATVPCTYGHERTLIMAVRSARETAAFVHTLCTHTERESLVQDKEVCLRVELWMVSPDCHTPHRRQGFRPNTVRLRRYRACTIVHASTDVVRSSNYHCAQRIRRKCAILRPLFWASVRPSLPGRPNVDDCNSKQPYGRKSSGYKRLQSMPTYPPRHTPLVVVSEHMENVGCANNNQIN
jgi:hypothetical protein